LFAPAAQARRDLVYKPRMDSNMVYVVAAFIPIVGILALVGAPVAIYLGNKYFKLKEKELALEAEARQWAEKQQVRLEARLQRVEAALMSIDARAAAQLMEPPATAEAGPLLELPPKVR
jgi:hypothetical protein